MSHATNAAESISATSMYNTTSTVVQYTRWTTGTKLARDRIKSTLHVHTVLLLLLSSTACPVHENDYRDKIGKINPHTTLPLLLSST